MQGTGGIGKAMRRGGYLSRAGLASTFHRGRGKQSVCALTNAMGSGRKSRSHALFRAVEILRINVAKDKKCVLKFGAHDRCGNRGGMNSKVKGTTMNGTSLLVMGVVSILCCPILGPVTWYLSNDAITKGTVPADDASKVNIARILGIIGTVLLVLGIIGRFALGIGAATGHVVPAQLML